VCKSLLTFQFERHFLVSKRSPAEKEGPGSPADLLQKVQLRAVFISFFIALVQLTRPASDTKYMQWRVYYISYGLKAAEEEEWKSGHLLMISPETNTNIYSN